MQKVLRIPDTPFGRYLRAGGWMTTGTLAVQVLRMGRMWILAWLLEPAFFGLAAITWTILATLKELTDTGLRHAFIQNPHALSRRYMDTYWTTCLARNLILAGLLFLFAPPLASLYGKPGLAQLIRLSCLILLLEGFSSAGLMALHKQIQAARIKAIEFSGQIIGISITITLAWFWKSPIVLVIGEAAVAAAVMIASYLAHSYRPHFRWYRHIAAQLFGYGIQLYLVELIMLMIYRIDVLILGKIATAAELGLYCLTMTLMMAAILPFQQVTVSVGFPTFSKHQNDLEQLRQITRKSTLTFFPLALIAFSLLGILAPTIVRLLPEKYSHIAPTLRYLCPAGLFIVTSTLATPQLYALKQLRGCLWMAVTRLTIMLLLIFPAWDRWGIKGFCLAMDTGTAVSMILIWLFMARALKWALVQILIDLAPIAVSVITALAGFALGSFLCQSPTFKQSCPNTTPWILGLILFCLTYLVYYSRTLREQLEKHLTRT